MGERMAAGGGLTGWLFGKWTYEQLLSHWNRQREPFHSGAQQHAQICGFDFTHRTTRPVQLDVVAWRHPQRSWHSQGSVQRGAGDHGQWSVDQLADGVRPNRRVLADDPPVGARRWPATVPGRCRSKVAPCRQRRNPSGVVVATYDPARDKCMRRSRLGYVRPSDRPRLAADAR